ncbi:MAG TPA: phosphodiester glycosidase family protein [Tepidisphaeraceae bacterium]
MSHERVSFNGCEFEVATVDPTQADLSLFWHGSDGSRYANFSGLRHALEKQNRRLVFATNAGIFDPTFTPVGVHVENGREYVPLNLKSGAGNFYLKPNGVFLVDAQGPRAIESKQYAVTRPDIRLATQSGPLLVGDGAINAQFQPQSTNKRIRSGIGVSTAHQVVFAISREPVTFHNFASLFRDRLACPNALYLDGVISRFYLASDANADMSDEDFAGMLAVTARK